MTAPDKPMAESDYDIRQRRDFYRGALDHTTANALDELLARRAASAGKGEAVALAHKDACLLGRIFNEYEGIDINTYVRINDWLKEQIGVALAAAPTPAPPSAEAVPGGWSLVPPTHRCKVCGAFWRRWPDSWSLLSATCGKCCDNVAMGEQIVALVEPGPEVDWAAWNCWCGAKGSGEKDYRRHKGNVHQSAPTPAPPSADDPILAGAKADERAKMEPMREALSRIKLSASPDGAGDRVRQAAEAVLRECELHLFDPDTCSEAEKQHRIGDIADIIKPFFGART